MPKTMKPKCTCGGGICGTRLKGRTYECKDCKRRVPWCYGAADNMPNVCDDCWTAEVA